MTWQAVTLDPADNVAVVLHPVAAGETIAIKTPGDIRAVTTTEAIPLCHKVALDDLRAGDPILRYGQCIGEARTTIRRGAWVHVHNLASRRARPPSTTRAA